MVNFNFDRYIFIEINYFKKMNNDEIMMKL